MMRGPVARILLAIVFAGLILSPLVVRRWSSERASAKLDRQSALARHGFYFEEVSRAAGVDFVHQAPTLDSRLEHIMPQVASMGASVSIVDFDRDGWPDIYVTTSKEGAKNALYRNQRDGTGVSMGAVWGDYDNDGYEDLLLIKWGKPELFHNDGGKGFTRVTEQVG